MNKGKKKMSEAELEKYRKNHPDITGMSSGKKDKDEEAMLNDISGGGASESGDPFDQLDDKPKPSKKNKKKESKPQDKENLQTDQQDEDQDLNDFISSKEHEESLVTTE
jgi:hypothetical protein